MMSRASSCEAPVIIVGAGMAGLSCAVHLQAAGLKVSLIDSSDGVGGRVRTDGRGWQRMVEDGRGW